MNPQNLAGWALLTDEQRADIQAHVDGLTIADTKPYEPPAHGWTCFHCGETFKTREGGALHFGQSVTGRPACDVDRPLIEAANAADAATWPVTTWAVPVADLRRFRDARQTMAGASTCQSGDAMREAVGLARTLHGRFYANVAQWRPLDDIRGVIMQINNMVAGVIERLEAAEIGRDNLRSAVLWALGEGDDFPLRQDGEGAYWWRKELRERAFPKDGES